VKSAFASCEDMIIDLSDLPSKMVSYGDKNKQREAGEKKLKTLVDNYEALLRKL